jgi:hypothetical protein
MKKVIGVLGLILLTFSVSAQLDNLLLSGEKETSHIGGFGGSIMLTSPVNSKFGLNLGGGGGIILNDFYLGVFGMHQQTQSLVDLGSTNVNQEVNLNYGGLWLGYSFKDSWLLHPYVGLRSGLGILEMHDRDNPTIELIQGSMVVLTPEIGFEFNVNSWMRISSTAGYRWLSEFDNRKLNNNKDYSGMTANLTFRFGLF